MEGLCSGRSLSKEGLFPRGVCPRGLCRRVSVQGISVQGVSDQGYLCPGSLCQWDICLGGSISRMISVQRGLHCGCLSRGLCLEVSFQRGSLSRGFLFRDCRAGDHCQGVSVWRRGVYMRGNLFGVGVSVERGSLSRGSLSKGSLSRVFLPRGLSVQKVTLCPGGGLCLGWSLSQRHKDPPYSNMCAVRILHECILV